MQNRMSAGVEELRRQIHTIKFWCGHIAQGDDEEAERLWERINYIALTTPVTLQDAYLFVQREHIGETTTGSMEDLR